MCMVSRATVPVSSHSVVFSLPMARVLVGPFPSLRAKFLEHFINHVVCFAMQKNAFKITPKNLANTSVVYWGGMLLALWEGG